MSVRTGFVSLVRGQACILKGLRPGGTQLPLLWNKSNQSQQIYPGHTLLPLLTVWRPVSFLNKLTANEIWKGVVAVSSAGKKRGRGKRVGRKKVTDLNKGQTLGSGKANVLWPGLNAPIIKGREVMKMKRLPPNTDRQEELVRMRDEMSKIRYPSLPPLLRGWTGKRFPGQSVGPPDPVGDYVFEGFDTRVLEFKLVTNMTGTLGRKQRFTALVVTGNKNGLGGFGLGRSSGGRTAIRVAKNRAAQRLQYIPLYDNQTVFHNMYIKEHRSKLFIHKKEKGYGLRCHRALKTICEVVGIKDLHCKVEGSTRNVKAITRGFFAALAEQETHQSLADRMGLHVVEQRKERENLPVVVASPSSGIVRQEELKNEEEDIEMDFERLYYGGKVELKRPPKKWFYEEYPSYKKRMRFLHTQRGQKEASILRQAGLA